MSQLRQRFIKKKTEVDDCEEKTNVEESEKETKDKIESEVSSEVSLSPGSYWLTRIVFLRYLSFIYLTAFLVSYNQNKELIGNNGLTPARNFLLNGKENTDLTRPDLPDLT